MKLRQSIGVTVDASEKCVNANVCMEGIEDLQFERITRKSIVNNNAHVCKNFNANDFSTRLACDLSDGELTDVQWSVY